MLLKNIKMKKLFLVFAISLTVFMSTNCDKKTDCNASIVVMDANGNVSNADVKLFATVNKTYTGDVKAKGTTDGSGQAKFTFKLPAIFDITATKVVGSQTLTGTGIIKLEEGKGNEKIIIIK